MASKDNTDFELHDKIEDLVAEGLLGRNTPAYRIAQLVIIRRGGYESLSQSERAIYDSIVVPTLEIRAAQLENQRVSDRKRD